MKQLIVLATALSICITGISLADQDRNRNGDRARSADAAGRDYPGRTNSEKMRLPERKPFTGWHEPRPSRDGTGLWHCGAVPTPGCRDADKDQD
jgi:hypothetical protein